MRRARMGYQPPLDGIRAVSVVAVILFHAGWAGMPGGFLGVEVFFVVSGYLITSLLFEEQLTEGRVHLGQFWLRRARRLLPALGVVLAATALWATFWGDEFYLGRLRRDILPGIFYVSNWWQIVDGQDYFASDSLALLRHLWSLAVEEQWYLVWPLAFVGLLRIVGGRAVRALPVLAGLALASAAVMVVTYTPERINLLYLGTHTRAAGLLVGAALACVWTPWRWPGAGSRKLAAMDVAGLGAMTVILLACWRLHKDDAFVYQGGLFLVSLLSMVVIGVVVHPGARLARQVFGNPVLVALGRRSYGLYLWHWPIFKGPFGGTSLPVTLVFGGLATAVCSELCYRFVEQPIRRGALGRWVGELRDTAHERRGALVANTALLGGSLLVVGAALGVRVGSADERNIAVGGGDAVFDLPAGGSTATTLPATQIGDATDGSSAATAPAASSSATTLLATTLPATTLPATTTTLARLPRRLVLVGDSQAESLYLNLPNGIDTTFAVTDGAVEGCSVYRDGTVFSATGFRLGFPRCFSWSERWATAAREGGAEVALVVLGAWDVFDVELDDGTVLSFGTAAADDRFLTGLQEGIDALVAAGAQVALLEVPCMRPVEARGAGTPPLPERGDDDRVAHLNELLREAVARNPETTTFVAGPTAWCADESIGANVAYRWDGVHVYKPGAELVMETIAPALLQIPVP
jgi:peptidoglycan/LPS O-acetylase OafA/YrhL